MTVERGVRMLAGTLVLLGTGLGYFVSPWFLLICVFVGANLFQSSLTRVCPAETILGKAGLPRQTS